MKLKKTILSVAILASLCGTALFSCQTPEGGTTTTTDSTNVDSTTTSVDTSVADSTHQADTTVVDSLK